MGAGGQTLHPGTEMIRCRLHQGVQALAGNDLPGHSPQSTDRGGPSCAARIGGLPESKSPAVGSHAELSERAPLFSISFENISWASI